MKLVTHISRIGFILLALAGIFGGCSKMDDTYKQFLEDGMKVYIGMVDSVFVYPGNNRLQLGWLPPSDSKAIRARVYWNNRQDSIDVPIERTEIGNDTVKVMFDELAEGTYVFEIFTFDDQGRRSLKKELVTRVYGDMWKNTLLSRPIDTYIADEEDVMKITWGAVPYPTVHGTEITYEDLGGENHTLFVPADETITYVPDFLTPQFVDLRTVYLPGPLALDTFYTEFTTQRLKGRPIELSKTGWTAEGSSEDPKGAGRPASNAIDGDPESLWVNNTTTHKEYPHTITVDMKTIYDVEGFAIITRLRDASARPKTIELYTSIDGEEWTYHLVTDLENTGDKQFISLDEPVQARYFRMKATASFNGGNIALAEIGMFYR
ncbi:hypothetical protein G5B30_06335 [Sphingobacterium sp. SGG-5]|uniref:DUF4998 domain-containing protein n=1 Tax=Sphingobacterium sp. SGG-5 TaxID=2710881 RepID=UPI0013EA4A67|nr:DUF4998 domain-containing protein [Sphingobacterium sp. SGG-5]NGM61536.1 hypothetical protein [Sphingobacterium sp. SGG-5]